MLKNGYNFTEYNNILKYMFSISKIEALPFPSFKEFFL